MMAELHPWYDSETGRFADVLIKSIDLVDPNGELIQKVGFTIWADAGLAKVIYDVEGISGCVEIGKCVYQATLDQRYDPAIVEGNIEKAIWIADVKRRVDIAEQIRTRMNGHA